MGIRAFSLQGDLMYILYTHIAFMSHMQLKVAGPTTFYAWYDYIVVVQCSTSPSPIIT